MQQTYEVPDAFWQFAERLRDPAFQVDEVPVVSPRRQRARKADRYILDRRQFSKLRQEVRESPNRQGLADEVQEVVRTLDANSHVRSSGAPTLEQRLLATSRTPQLLTLLLEHTAAAYSRGVGDGFSGSMADSAQDHFAALIRLVKGTSLDGCCLLPDSSSLVRTLRIAPVKVLSDSHFAVLEASVLDAIVRRCVVEAWPRLYSRRSEFEAQPDANAAALAAFFRGMWGGILEALRARCAVYLSTLERAFGLERWLDFVSDGFVPPGEYLVALEALRDALPGDDNLNERANQFVEGLDLVIVALRAMTTSSTEDFIDWSRRFPAVVVARGINADCGISSPDRLVILSRLLDRAHRDERHEVALEALNQLGSVAGADVSLLRGTPDEPAPGAGILARALELVATGDDTQHDAAGLLADLARFSLLGSLVDGRGEQAHEDWESLTGELPSDTWTLTGVQSLALGAWLSAVASMQVAEDLAPHLEAAREVTRHAVEPRRNAGGKLQPFQFFGGAAISAIRFYAQLGEVSTVEGQFSDLLGQAVPAIPPGTESRDRLNSLVHMATGGELALDRLEWTHGKTAAQIFDADEFLEIREQISSSLLLPIELQKAYLAGGSSSELRAICEALGQPEIYTPFLSNQLHPEDVGALVAQTVMKGRSTSRRGTQGASSVPILIRRADGTFHRFGEVNGDGEDTLWLLVDIFSFCLEVDMRENLNSAVQDLDGVLGSEGQDELSERQRNALIRALAGAVKAAADQGDGDVLLAVLNTTKFDESLQNQLARHLSNNLVVMRRPEYVNWAFRYQAPITTVTECQLKSDYSYLPSARKQSIRDGA